MAHLDTISTPEMTSPPESERPTLATVSSSATLASEHGIFPEDFMSTHGHLLSATENIPAFYKNASIFITGATGFLGKSILEKLLRSCHEIDKIYVLVRSKKGHCPSERVEALFNSKLFDRAQSERGAEECRRKVVAVAGDVMEPNLGISEEDEQMLMSSNITTVIHSAATIRFDEPLRFALDLNVGGTLRVVQLCRKLTSLRALVHVSTAYANCDLPFIEEQVYPPPVNPHKLLDALDWMTDEAASKITPVLIGGKPNTYTYTKHLAENLLMEEAGDSLPYIIVRPSIVGASWKEPFPGWIDNFNGPSGLFIACGMGLLRSMIGKPDAIADIVPVDIVSNVIIAAPWYRASVLTNNSAVANNFKLNLTNNPLLSNSNNSNFPSHLIQAALQAHGDKHEQQIENDDNSTRSTVDSSADHSETSSEIELSLNSPSGATALNNNENNAASVMNEKVVSNNSVVTFTQQTSGETTPEQTPIVAPFILNCCSGYIEKPLNWGPLSTIVANSYLRNPIQKAVRYPSYDMTNNKMMYFLWVFTCHRIPAILMDTYMRVIGKKPRMMSMYRKLHRSMETLAFFTQRHWEWEVRTLRHMQHLIERQQTSPAVPSSSASSTSSTASTDDKKQQPVVVNWGVEWNTSVKNIDWAEYLENFCVGTKCFVLNEEMSKLHLARKRMSRLKTLHYLFNIFTAAIVWRVIMLKSEVASKLWTLLVRFCFKWIEYLRLSRFVTL